MNDALFKWVFSSMNRLDLLNLLNDDGFYATGLSEEYDLPLSSVMKAVNELYALGLIEEVQSFGRKRVYVLTSYGKEFKELVNDFRSSLADLVKKYEEESVGLVSE